MRINYNVSAVIANNYLNRSDNKLQESMARLSSGLKIVNAKDNPAGLAMAKRMNAQLEGLDQATQNSNDGISVMQIADGALSEIHEMLQRINELSVKAATGTLTDDDREIINQEVKQLTEEIDRTASEVEFNGQKLLDGSFDLKAYTDDPDVKVAYYSDEVVSGEYQIEALDVKFDVEGKEIENVNDILIKRVTDSGEEVVWEYHDPDPNNKSNSTVTMDGKIVTVKDNQGREIKIETQKESIAATVKVVVPGFGSLDMQIGSNEGQQLAARIPKVSTELMGISNIDLTTQEGAKETIEKVKGAIQYVSSVRSRLGAYENRLDHTVNNLDIITENVTAAYSRIMDTDMSEEMTEYTTLQVLSQASTSILAQANERPAQVAGIYSENFTGK